MTSSRFKRVFERYNGLIAQDIAHPLLAASYRLERQFLRGSVVDGNRHSHITPVHGAHRQHVHAHLGFANRRGHDVIGQHWSLGVVAFGGWQQVHRFATVSQSLNHGSAFG